MSMKQAGEWSSLAIQQIREKPLWWFAFGASEVLILWSQDLVPLLGTLAASVFSAFLVGRLYSLSWREAVRPLIGLGLLMFPVAALWPILLSLTRNMDWTPWHAATWSLPLLFFMSIALFLFAFTAGTLVERRADSLDSALKGAWKQLYPRWKTLVWLCFFMAVLFALSLISRGGGFFLTTPFVLALMKVSREKTAA